MSTVPFALSADIPSVPAAVLEAMYGYEGGQTKASRKAGGVFYTPWPLVQSLVQWTLGAYLTDWDARFNVASGKERQKLLAELTTRRIMDPACGTGVFLVAALGCLAAHHQAFCHRLTPGERDEFGEALTAAAIVRHQLEGVDIDEAAIRIARCALREVALFYEADRKAPPLPESDLNAAIRCGNTLLAAPGKPVHWMLGNPPYVSETRGNKALFQELRDTSVIRDSLSPKMDLADAFTRYAIHYLSGGGELAFILPVYWMQRQSATRLRGWLQSAMTLQAVVSFQRTGVFPDAPGHHTSILMARKTPADANRVSSCHYLEADSWPLPAVDKNHWEVRRLRWQGPGRVLSLVTPETDETLSRMAESGYHVPSKAIQQGVVFPQARISGPDGREAGVFVLSPQELANLHLNPAETALLKPYYPVSHYRGPFAGFGGEIVEEAPPYWMIYGDRAARKAMMKTPHRYPSLRAHLDSHRSFMTSAHKPYGLHRPRQPHWFETPGKILCPRQTLVPAASCVPFPACVSEAFNIIDSQKAAYPAGVLTALLNSKPVWYWCYHAKRKGVRLQWDKEVLSGIPLPVLSENAAHQLGLYAETLSQKPARTDWEEMNAVAAAAYGLTQAMRTHIDATFESLIGRWPA